MRATFGGGGGAVHFREIPEPTLASALGAIVRPLAVAMCDLDIAYLLNLLPADAPYAVGHEFTAAVVEIGEGVTRVRPGDRVVVPFQISCGECERCRAGRSLDCSSVPPLSTFGLAPFGGGEWGGACAELVSVPFADAMCVLLPTDADAVQLASVSDNVVDGFRCVAPHVRPGDEVLVLGSASVGLYATAVARALGHSVTYVDSDPFRLGLADTLGATVVPGPPRKDYGQFSVTAVCNSDPWCLASALASTEPGGICQAAGIPFFGVDDLDFVELYRRGIALHTGRANARDDIPAVLELIRTERLDPGLVTGNVIDFDDVPELLESTITHKTIVRMPDA